MCGEKKNSLPFFDLGVGVFDYMGQLKHPFTAHPKVDPLTNEMVFFGYQTRTKTPQKTLADRYFQLSTAQASSSSSSSSPPILRAPVGITLRAPVMIHDFAITEHYAIVPDLSLRFCPKSMVKEGKYDTLTVTECAE